MLTILRVVDNPPRVPARLPPNAVSGRIPNSTLLSEAQNNERHRVAPALTLEWTTFRIITECPVRSSVCMV